MHRRPVSISILGGYMSIASVVMIFVALRLVFLNEDPLFKLGDNGKTVVGSLPLFVGLGVSVINFICAVNILEGQNWARWIYTMTAVSLFAFQLVALEQLNAVIWLSVAFRCVMIFFLFTPASNDFFKNETEGIPAHWQSRARSGSTESHDPYGCPLSVTIVGWILCVTGALILFGALSLMALSDDPRLEKALASIPIPPGAQVALLALTGILNVVSGGNILGGKNWARWLFTAFVVVGIVLGVIFTHNEMLLVPGVLFQGTLILFLFRPNANDYFARD